jgi:hypothetical protein
MPASVTEQQRIVPQMNFLMLSPMVSAVLAYHLRAFRTSRSTVEQHDITNPAFSDRILARRCRARAGNAPGPALGCTEE